MKQKKALFLARHFLLSYRAESRLAEPMIADAPSHPANGKLGLKSKSHYRRSVTLVTFRSIFDGF